MCIFIYDILSEMFKLLSLSYETLTCLTNHTQWRSFCWTLYNSLAQMSL